MCVGGGGGSNCLFVRKSIVLAIFQGGPDFIGELFCSVCLI